MTQIKLLPAASAGSARLRKSSTPYNPCSFLLALLLAFIAMFGSAAHAQLSGAGAISGTVTDDTGAVIPGATVTATAADTGVKVTRTSTGSGDYSITPLNPGKYTVTVVANGFQQLVQQNVNVDALATATVDVKLIVGNTSETVTVSAAPPQLSTSDAALGGVMENDMYSALPIEMGAYGNPDQRRATDFAFLMPGVQGNNTSGNPTTNTGIVNGSGSKGGVTAVYIDGVPFVRAAGNGDPRFVWTAISVDAVDQFQLQTNGYSAIYEGQGIQNYTLKHGGNKYHGSIYEFFRNTALDTWGFFGANAPAGIAPTKPIEHSNEYGINISGPLVPFGSWKDKLFFYGNYNGFRFSSQTPTAITLPTNAQQQGNFVGVQSGGIFDPNTQAVCTANSSTGPCRYRYGYGPGGTVGAAGAPVLTGAPVDVIPSSQFSQIALKLQSFLPALNNQNLSNNYFAQNKTGLTNWSHTERIDYTISSKNTLTIAAAIGRQASSVPVGQTTAGRNVGPVPYNYGQAYAPKTAVGIIEDTHVFTSNLLNQFKLGYARYDGPTFNADQLPAYAASAMGLTGLPAGQAQQDFPIVSFAGTNAPTQWGGATTSRSVAENYTLVDTVQWVKGKHSFSIGGQIAWLLYQNTPATGGTTQLTMANAVAETANYNGDGTFAAKSNTGLSYASFLIGQIDSGKLTQYAVQEFGSRFRAISPYIQDNWKVTPKLTLDIGIRYDFFPALVDVHDNLSFFNPTLANPTTGTLGGLQFAGSGAGTCNCRTPANNFYKNIGPRLGIAYQVDAKTVLRGSYGVMYTHGNGVGGGSTSGASGNSLGFSATPNPSANSQLLSSFDLSGTKTAFPAFSPALGRSSGVNYGTGYTTVNDTTGNFTGTPSGVAYIDPYLGSRAPQYINWSVGIQRQVTPSMVATITYVGSQGHFLSADGSNARGFWADQLDPKYLSLGSNLALTGTKLTAFCAANATVCPSYSGKFNATAKGGLATLLQPFPFQAVSDTFGNVANTAYHAIQAQLNMRPSHGITFSASYTFSRSIDDAGTFRSGYAIPAAYSNSGHDWAPDRIERSVSTSNQPQHVVLTGVWNLPIGTTILNHNAMERAVLGGFKFSTIFQAFSGSPLAITGSSCNPNPAQITCMPSYNPALVGSARKHGSWGQGVTRSNFSTSNTSLTTISANQFIDPNAFAYAPAYTFGNLPRTAAYNIYGPGNYNLDISLRRSFGLHFTEAAKLDFQADLYNVTNHTQFSVASAVYGNSNFGQVAGTQANSRRSAQFTARLNF